MWRSSFGHNDLANASMYHGETSPWIMAKIHFMLSECSINSQILLKSCTSLWDWNHPVLQVRGKVFYFATSEIFITSSLTFPVALFDCLAIPIRHVLYGGLRVTKTQVKTLCGQVLDLMSLLLLAVQRYLPSLDSASWSLVRSECLSLVN